LTNLAQYDSTRYELPSQPTLFEFLKKMLASLSTLIALIKDLQGPSD